MNLTARWITITLMCLLSACATVEGPANPDDPYESFNRSVFAFNEAIDSYALKPVAEGYQAVTPEIVDTGITNFFSNLDDIVVIINDLLQLKFEQAARDLSRFMYNTTFGLFGFFDVATSFGLEKNNEDFGQTLGYWGVGDGPYLVLPVFGPSNARDAVGFVVDSSEFDVVLDELEDAELYTAVTLKVVDARADLLGAINIIDETAPDKYAFLRDAYLARRNLLVHDGSPPDDGLSDDDFSEEELFEDELFEEELER